MRDIDWEFGIDCRPNVSAHLVSILATVAYRYAMGPGGGGGGLI